jgi:sugar-specific transcriptional regulator TrmB
LFCKKKEQKIKELEHKVDMLVKELEAYKSFAAEALVYAGNCGVWKAQQEFREVVSSFQQELKNPHHFAYLDAYFDRVREAAITLSKAACTPMVVDIDEKKWRDPVFVGDAHYQAIAEICPDMETSKKKIVSK